MKKAVVVMLSLTLLVAIPGLALALKGGVKPAGPAAFESDLITLYGTCTVVGEVFVRRDGTAKLEFKLPEAVAADTEFDVYLFCFWNSVYPFIGPVTVTIPEGEKEFSAEALTIGTIDFDCGAPAVYIEGPGFEAISGWCGYTNGG